jgi:hypothetical protein
MIGGEDFIALAAKLAANPSADEATCRTAISRAYYGAFHLAKGYVESLGLKVSRNHGYLHPDLTEAGNLRLRTAGGFLTNLHTIVSRRITPDPDVATLRAARLCVELADKFRKILGELSQPELQQEIQAGIEKYRQKVHRN